MKLLSIPCMRISILLVIIIIFSQSCQRMDREAAEIVKKMTLNQKIGQMLLVGVPGDKISAESEKIIKDYLPGGVIFFGYNLKGKSEIKKYIDDLQGLSYNTSGIPLFISIDQEGGRVKRIRDGVTLFPGNMAFGVLNDEDLMFEAARILGIELRLLGVNMNLAPVLDVNNNPLNPVINIRSFGSDKEIVSDMGVAYIKGLQSSMCISVGKHFPGHGDTDKDSHLTLPVIPYDLERMKKIEFPPFYKAIDADVECIMTAHISYPKILKNKLPATISGKFLNGILRKDMGFKGIIITDDLEMKAISRMMDLGEAAVRSIEAGTDIVLVSTHGESIEKVTGAIKKAVAKKRISIERIESSVKRIIEMKLRYRIMGYSESKISTSKMKFNDEIKEILSKADKLNRRVSRESIYLYKKDSEALILLSNNSMEKYFITDNELFIKACENSKNKKFFKNENEFLEFLKKSDKGNKELIIDNDKSVLYYHLERFESVTADNVISAAREKGMKIVILCTGNPFPIGKLKYIPPTLFAFSNTKESVRQIIACLNGEFKPRRNINIQLGFK